MSFYFAIFGLLNVLKGVQSDCPTGFEHHGTQCYKASGLEASWIEAKFYCRALGTDLAIINTAVEETYIEGMISRLHGAHIDQSYWLSGADIVTEKDWRWIAGDGQSYDMTYTNWGHGLPDNSGGQENCLLVHFKTNNRVFWNDNDCSTLHSFLCQVPFYNTTYPTDEVLVG